MIDRWWRVVGSGVEWFIALPDHASDNDTLAGLIPDESRVLRHPSGRPWLIGSWADDDLTLVETEAIRLAVVGRCPVAREELRTRVEREPDLDRLAGFIAGDCHLLAVKNGNLRVQGSAYGLRQVYHTRVGRMTVAASHTDVLAAITGAALNEEQMAVHLLYPQAPPPLSDTPLWQGVHAVPPGSYLTIAPNARCVVKNWWVPPEPTLSLKEGARALRETLRQAVALQTRGHMVVSCDLSGGLDSTSVCFLAHQGHSRVFALTLEGMNPAQDDAAWARRAAAHLPGVEHIMLGPGDTPAKYIDLDSAGVGLDEPFLGIADHARLRQSAALMTRHGSTTHLSGHGGDEVLQVLPPYLHELVLTNLPTAIRHLRGYSALCHWSWTSLARALTDRRSYRTWLATTGDDLVPSNQQQVFRAPLLGWGPPPLLPPWATHQTIDLVRTAVRRAATTAESLAPTHGQHMSIQAVRFGSRLIRNAKTVMARAGLPLAAPFLDDRVIDTCLSVRMHERRTPWRYKPLIVEAMHGIVPDTLLTRATKGDFGEEMRAGRRIQRAAIVDLLDQSILAQLGLVRPDTLRAAGAGISPPNLPPAALDYTLACETWLRAHIS